MSKFQTSPSPLQGERNWAQNHDAARMAAAHREHGESWKSLPGSKPVAFMDINSGMCRWPIGDPRQFDAFRFCGCACRSEARYCSVHEGIAAGPIRSTGAPFRNANLIAVK